MTFEEYYQQFDEILTGKITRAPYDTTEFLEYTKLNYSRLKRWLKTGELLPELSDKIKNLTEKQHWVLVTEHWCGDAAHVLPFVEMLNKLNDKIELKIELRDHDSEIDSYLTNGTKSIPIFIIRNDDEKDLFVWGPRPAPAKNLILTLKKTNLPKDEQKTRLQAWYNDDKGFSFQHELMSFFSTL